MADNHYRYAIIGTGRPHGSEGATGFGMAHPHMHGFTATGKVKLVAVADVRADNANAFVAKYGSDAKIYPDYSDMLTRERPDIVSITTWPDLHADMVVAACQAGVRAIHCEKPMATTWGDAKRMKAAADESGTTLTFNHQRRFLEPFQHAVHLIQGGELGDLLRIEAQCGDMYDWGTHWLDMMQYFNSETPAEWVLAQMDSRTDRQVFGVRMEDQAVCHIKYANGVRGLMIAGHEAKWDCALRVTGAHGVIEVLWGMPCLRVRVKGDTDWRIIETTEGIHGDIAIDRACADLVRALDEPGYKPMLSVDNAIRTAEIIMAAYYSAAKRGRVDLPLAYEGNGLHDLMNEGAIGPAKD